MTRSINFVVVHCTTHDDATVDTIRRYHVQNRHYSDIGYHAVVHRDGSVHAGRPEIHRGAHCNNPARSGTPVGTLTRSLMTGGENSGNAGSLGVVVCGNYQRLVPTQGQIEALINQIGRWCQVYGIDPMHIFGHRDFLTTKPCPGQNVYSRLPYIREEVRHRLGR